MDDDVVRSGLEEAKIHWLTAYDPPEHKEGMVRFVVLVPVM